MFYLMKQQKIYLVCFFCLSFFTLQACLPGGMAGNTHCSQLTFDTGKKAWIDGNGNIANCTFSDNKIIFDYIPQVPNQKEENTQCNPWRKINNMDNSVKFSEVVLKNGEQNQGRKYCVLTQYITKDSTNKVMLINNRLCFKPLSQDNFLSISCDGVTQKATQD